MNTSVANIIDMPAPEIVEDTATFFKVLGDPTRLRILFTLYEGELCVNDISESISMTVSAVSHQLSLLKRAKLVASRREGKLVYYRLDDNHVSTILAMAEKHLSE